MSKPVKPKPWHPEDIKAAVRKRGVSLAALSRSHGLPEHACRHALRYPYFEAEMAIAETLGLSPRQIWPERYDAGGATRHPSRRSRAKNTRTAITSKRQKGRESMTVATTAAPPGPGGEA